MRKIARWLPESETVEVLGPHRTILALTRYTSRYSSDLPYLSDMANEICEVMNAYNKDKTEKFAIAKKGKPYG